MQGPVHPTRCQAGPAQHQGHPVSDQVGGLMVAVDPELTQVLAVIARHHDSRVVIDAQFGEHRQDAPDVLIRVADADVVTVEQPPEIVRRRHLLRLAREGPQTFHRAESEHLLGRMRTGQTPMPLGHLSRDPRRDGLVFEGVSVLQGSAVRRMRVPQVDVQEPVVTAALAAEPVDREWRDLIGGLAPVGPQIEDLIESRVPVERRVPLGERADRRAPQPGPAQQVWPRAVGQPGLAAPVGVRREQLGPPTTVVDHAVGDAETSGEQGGPGRQAR